MNLGETTTLNTVTAQEYKFSGKTQTRIETLFTENETSCLVKHSEVKGEKAAVEVKDFNQTSDAFIDVLSADLTGVIDNLTFQLGERETLKDILNIDEVWGNWKTRKVYLMEKYSEIPDFDSISDNFGNNLKNEEQLLLSIENKGIYALLFPQVKFLSYGRIPNETVRSKIIREGVLSKDLPIRERIKIRENDNEFLVEVKGELDTDNFDYDGFLNVSRQMFGGQVKAEDISFQSTENYSLDKRTLRYINGTRHHYFEIKGSYFRDDKQEFRLKD